MTVGTLTEELWGRQPPRSARPTLQTYIMHLRDLIASALAAAGDDTGNDDTGDNGTADHGAAHAVWFRIGERMTTAVAPGAAQVQSLARST